IEHGTGKTFHFGYSKVILEPQAKQDALFSKYEDKSMAAFAHRYIINELPQGAVLLARTVLLPIASFKKGNLYCVQWKPDMDLQGLLKSANEHRRSSLIPSYKYEPSLNPYSIGFRHNPDYDRQNAQALDLFFEKIIE
ncbi:MAG: hypothetical protein QW275_02855, partial [Candidatus Anstonellaceae archaeon]